MKYLKMKNVVPVYITKTEGDLLNDKVALIIGGSGGIGFGIAESFVNHGCKVVLAGTNINSLKENCLKLGGVKIAKYIILDLTKVSEFSEKIQEANNKFPNKNIDILVNGAGVHSSSPVGEVTESNYDMILDINLKGMFFMCQEIGNYMKKNNIKGHILNLSSASALKPACSPYEISKWGVRGLTLGIAENLVPYGIIVNAIGPGPVSTKMLGKKDGDSLYSEYNPIGRFSTPCEIGQLAVYMVSDVCNMVIGDTFYITGGSGTIKL